MIESLLSALSSPFSLAWILATVQPMIFYKLRAYARAAMPKPSTPDRYSLKAAEEDGLGNDSIAGLCTAPDGDPAYWESHGLLEELAKDLQCIGRNYQTLYDYFASFFSNEPKMALDGSNQSYYPVTRNRRLSTPEAVDIHSGSTTSSVSSNESTPYLSRRTMTRLLSEVTPIDARTTTLPMNNQIPVINPNPEPDHRDNPSSTVSRNETRVYDSDNGKKNQPSLHRVTALTTYAADGLAWRVSLHLVDVLLLPLESFYLRSLAISFLSSPRADSSAQAAAARWKNEIFPLGGWCGMGFRGSWKGAANYAMNMALVFGMEMGVSFTIWQICTGVAWVNGRKLFDWGRL